MAFNLLLENLYKQSIYFGFDITNEKEDIFNNKLHGVPFVEPLVIKRDVKYLIKKDIKFIYPISAVDENVFNNPPFKLRPQVIDRCKKGFCKVGIMHDTEGQSNVDKVMLLLWLDSFAMLNELDGSNFFFAHGDRKLRQTYEDIRKGREFNKEPLVNILKYSYFENFPWFTQPDANRVSLNNEELLEHAVNVINNSRSVKKEKYFLCLNRVLRLPRLLIFGAIATNPDLVQKTILSIGKNQTGFGSLNQNLTSTELSNFLPDRIADYVRSYDFDNPKHILDNPDNSNKAFGINIDFHQSTFLNIVTETLHRNDTMFFSEKIFKPMYMFQPFILVGNPNSLKELHQMGYKTFSKWWDESYDEEKDLVKRVLMIEKLLMKLSKLSTDDLFKITQEMEETLIHNFNRYLFDIKQETLDYLNFFTMQDPAPPEQVEIFKLHTLGEKIELKSYNKIIKRNYCSDGKSNIDDSWARQQFKEINK